LFDIFRRGLWKNGVKLDKDKYIGFVGCKQRLKGAVNDQIGIEPAP